MRKPALSILAVALSTACGPQTIPAPGGPETGEPPAHTERGQSLQALNQELARTWFQDAIKMRPYFEPLCDAEGYPLVGNIASKGGTSATEFCSFVRTTR